MSKCNADDHQMLLVIRVLGVRPCCEEMANKIDLGEVLEALREEIGDDDDRCVECGRGFDLVILGPGDPRPRGVASNFFRKK